MFNIVLVMNGKWSPVIGNWTSDRKYVDRIALTWNVQLKREMKDYYYQVVEC